MKTRLLRALALALLLAVAAGIVPAMAATEKAKAKILVETLYPDYEDGYQMRFDGMPQDANIVSVKSSNKKVIKADGAYLYPLKPGKATITVRYQDGTKTYSIKAAFTVKKSYKAVKKLVINNKKMSGLNQGVRTVFYRHYDDRKKSYTISLTPHSGWKVSRVSGFYTDWDYENMVLGTFTLPAKNKVTVKVALDRCAFVTYVLKNSASGETFKYTVEIARVGE